MNLVLVRMSIKTKQYNYQIISQMNYKKTTNQDVNQILIQGCKDMFVPRYFQSCKALQNIKLLYSRQFGNQLNIQLENTLIQLDLLSNYAHTKIEVESVSIDDFISSLASYTSKVEKRSILNQLPDQLRNLIVEKYYNQLTAEQVQLISPGYKLNLLGHVKTYFTQPSVKFEQISVREIPLQAQNMLKTSKYLQKSVCELSSQQLLACKFCSSQITKINRRFQTNTLIVILKDEILSVQQFNKFVFQDLFKKTSQGGQYTLQQNFVNYLRNEEMKPFQIQFVNEVEVEQILRSIADKIIIDAREDKEWVTAHELGVLNENQPVVAGMETDHHAIMLGSYIEGGYQKMQEILYFVHFLKEINWFAQLSTKIREQIQATFDAIVGSIAVLKYLNNQMSYGNYQEVQAIEFGLIKNVNNDMLIQGKIEHLSILETVLSKVDIQIQHNLFIASFLQINEYELLAEYLDQIVNERLNNSQQLSVGFMVKSSWLPIAKLENILTKPFASLQLLVKLVNCVLFFEFDLQKRDNLFQIIYQAAVNQQFCVEVGKIFARYHDYQHCVQYCLEKLKVERIDNKCDYLMHSYELWAKNYSLSDRLAFYYEQHLSLQESFNPTPSMLEVENRKYQLNHSLQKQPNLILPDELLAIFKQVQMDDEIFAALGKTDGFGEELLRRVEGLNWLY
ncbi:Conserved_hypothetical protein [Hexamita inflata]|uniref:Uncharacterized protein n=1 Tax=Hexamita inflata TaxID=28002 RepID=A0AA86P1D0_9EUKA|nr:Conserved hypothetical protein [Hexamita inflata]